MNMKKIARACGQHFESIRVAAATRRKWLIFAAAGIGLATTMALLIPKWIDFTGPITSAEMEALTRFVQRTNSLVVRQAFDDARRGGEISVKRAEAIIDLAKAQLPAYGLASDR